MPKPAGRGMAPCPGASATSPIGVSALGAAPGPRSRPQRSGMCRAGSRTYTDDQVMDRDHPPWAGGDDLLSKCVNFAFSIPPLYALMKGQARKVLIETAEKNKIEWRAEASRLESNPELYQLKEELTDSSVDYPSYYTQEFHAYEEGNLNWQAACEVEPATYSMALRVWPKEGLEKEEAQRRLRSSFLDCVQAYREKVGAVAEPKDILDIGCSVGISTRALARAHPSAQVTGLDLSPYFLAVAALRDRLDPSEVAFDFQKRREGDKPIKWLHAKAESTGLPDGSFDMITIQFVCHELPQAATRDIFKEARRLLRPGGMLAMCDNNPRSPVIQGLPPVLFTLMKSTEPWSDEYYTFDQEQCMREAGFQAVETVASDPRHRTVMAVVRE
eukprot:CAMPEP_0117662048 /NCGR_PEP_ID=MMETSP0804-20121206/7853_1 /TAXON_ID=1074897 /ORGANISM="Tetraselmis astigmatica, Strain CCMP880" /LENGTH=386 /DNA_ID=CAMNT_0005468937 /DNA_START=183 /DNA_END=1343 /DNA_ORIENTATION=-